MKSTSTKALASKCVYYTKRQRSDYSKMVSFGIMYILLMMECTSLIVSTFTQLLYLSTIVK